MFSVSIMSSSLIMDRLVWDVGSNSSRVISRGVLQAYFMMSPLHRNAGLVAPASVRALPVRGDRCGGHSPPPRRRWCERSHQISSVPANLSHSHIDRGVSLLQAREILVWKGLVKTLPITVVSDCANWTGCMIGKGIRLKPRCRKEPQFSHPSVDGTPGRFHYLTTLLSGQQTPRRRFHRQ